MYRHLLVPIDGTDLSTQVVGNAVGLARAVGARITFFHAVVGEAGSPTEDVNTARTRSQDRPAHETTGKAWELLSKAEAASRAFGVPCHSKGTVSDKPAAAIVEAARSSGCDLIFMASHGTVDRPGLAPASATLAVLANAGLPVLVSGTGEPGPPARAIGIIRDEHRSLAAVLHTWMHALAAARDAGGVADPGLMRDIVRYVEAFSALHDPKEERHLFGRLRERTTSVNAELDEIERLHVRERERVGDLVRGVAALAAANGESAAVATRELEAAVHSHAACLWDHLGREEGVILPAAQRHLTDADWCEIEAAWVENGRHEPSTGEDESLPRLFSRIVNAGRG